MVRNFFSFIKQIMNNEYSAEIVMTASSHIKLSGDAWIIAALCPQIVDYQKIVLVGIKLVF